MRLLSTKFNTLIRNNLQKSNHVGIINRRGISRTANCCNTGLKYFSLPNIPETSEVIIPHASRKMSTASIRTTPEILINVENRIRCITIDRQAKKNAINGNMYKALTDAFNSANEDSQTNIIVLTGKGEYYTAGNDMKDIESIKTQEYKYFVHALIDCKKPVIALVNGPAIGIGVTALGLVDGAYASDKATFSTPFSKIGIVAEGCSTYTFPRIMGNSKASELLYFSRKINAQEALSWGLVGEVFPDGEFQEKAWAKVREIAQLPIKSLIYSKDLVRSRERELLHQINDKESDKLLQCVKDQLKELGM